MDLLLYFEDVLARFDLTVVEFIAISFLSTVGLLVVKFIQELAGHFSHRFSMYRGDEGIFYGILCDIATLFPLILLFDFLAIWLIPLVTDWSGIAFVWSYCTVVFVISYAGMRTDLKGCELDNWYMGDYPVPMVYFNWQMDFWANGAILLLILGEDWILFNVVMMIALIIIAILSIVFKRKGIDWKLRRRYSCPMREW